MKSTHAIYTLMHYTYSLVLDYSKEYVSCTHVVSIHKFGALVLPLCMMTYIYPYTYIYCASIMCACINYDIVLCSAKIGDKTDCLKDTMCTEHLCPDGQLINKCLKHIQCVCVLCVCVCCVCCVCVCCVCCVCCVLCACVCV